jgi:hypothetical protein
MARPARKVPAPGRALWQARPVEPYPRRADGAWLSQHLTKPHRSLDSGAPFEVAARSLELTQTYSFGLSGLFWFTVPNGLAVIAAIPFVRKIRTLMPDGYTIPEFVRVRFEGRGAGKVRTDPRVYSLGGRHGLDLRPFRTGFLEI